MKIKTNDLKFKVQTINRIDSEADVEFHGNSWKEGDVEYNDLDSVTLKFSASKNENAKLIVKLS